MELGKADPDPDRNCESDLDVEYDSISLPPPRRSPASRFRPRTSSIHRIVSILKWSLALFAILFLLYLIPRDTDPPPEDFELPLELIILLWNEKPRIVWNHCRWDCIITSNPDYFNQTIDAVIVNADQPYTLEGITEVSQSTNFLLVYAASKPLSQLETPLFEDDGVTFNYTMTYRTDSDLLLRRYYFCMLDSDHEPVHEFDPQDHQLNENLLKAPFQFVRDKLLFKEKGIVHIAQDDHKFTLFQSTFLKKMRKYVEITTLSSSQAHNNITSYMFMLVFESTSCPDYVHPHVYLALSNFIVPVLIGGSSVHKLIPPDSYIDGNLYPPPKLAEYLLDAGGALYEHFFWWHSKYQLHKIREPYCDLCDQLHRNRKPPKYESFQRWWSDYKCPGRRE